MHMNETEAQKLEYQKELFKNRLSKKSKNLRKWAKKNRITCYRLYDRDIPEIPLAVDLYEFLPEGIEDKIDAAAFMREEESLISQNDESAAKSKASRQIVHIFLYERPYEKDPQDEEIWLKGMADTACQVLHLNENQVVTKVRKKQKGSDQYEKIQTQRKIEGIIQECGSLFKTNLSEYLDTGLFFDHRPNRQVVRDSSAKKSILNLFCYTGSFSVYAAQGGARRVESVDLSNTYLHWAKENMALNGFTDEKAYVFTKSDVLTFLDKKVAEEANDSNRYDIIVLDPPTFSNSKSTSTTLDINRDWSTLVIKCLNLLTSGGVLYFSTNSRRLIFDRSLLPQATSNKAVIAVEDKTEESIDEDFKGNKPHRLWEFSTGSF